MVNALEKASGRGERERLKLLRTDCRTLEYVYHASRITAPSQY